MHQSGFMDNKLNFYYHIRRLSTSQTLSGRGRRFNNPCHRSIVRVGGRILINRIKHLRKGLLRLKETIRPRCESAGRIG
jgi:hypothetical protein